ncbi:hypothetical protein GN956_G11580 [Arapaima gigas]
MEARLKIQLLEPFLLPLNTGRQRLGALLCKTAVVLCLEPSSPSDGVNGLVLPLHKRLGTGAEHLSAASSCLYGEVAQLPPTGPHRTGPDVGVSQGSTARSVWIPAVFVRWSYRCPPFIAPNCCSSCRKRDRGAAWSRPGRIPHSVTFHSRPPGMEKTLRLRSAGPHNGIACELPASRLISGGRRSEAKAGQVLHRGATQLDVFVRRLRLQCRR